jgi:lipopolysaccharide transport system ATP-binding protein
MSAPIISVQSLGKKYLIQHQSERQRYTALRDVIAERAKGVFQKLKFGKTKDSVPNQGCPSSFNPPSASAAPVHEDFWALRDVTFEVGQGEVVGVIGRNGAGKSTLLKILSRITEPTEGRVEINGRVASLLEVGTGFHPELTGRENIFLNGAILGMTRVEIKKKFDEIVAFAGVEKFLDTPVKRYSSGMYLRLAFAVAAHLEPEILLVDEVLAVGDAAFQRKCLGKMQDVAKGGRTVLLVSHNMGVVSTLTERSIYLQDGLIAASGNSRDVVEMYMMKSVEAQTTRTKGIENYRRNQNSDAPVTITSIGVNGCGSRSGALPSIEIGADFTIEVELAVREVLHSAMLDILLKSSRAEPVAMLFSMDQGFILSLDPGRHVVTVRVSNLPLAPGHYFVDLGINQSENTRAYDVILDFPFFDVVNNGQVLHWLDRPWGLLHSNSVVWNTSSLC